MIKSFSFLFCVFLLIPVSARQDSSATSFDTLTIIGVGDIMMGTDFPSSIYLPPGNDCQPLLNDVSAILRDADITVGNLEGTFAGDKGTPKKCKDTTKCFVFRMPEHYVHCLVDGGFDMVSIANNHANDFGASGKLQTEWVLESHGIASAGSYSAPAAIVVKDGIRYGLIAFAPNLGCFGLDDLDAAAWMVDSMKQRCDILMVSFHGGAEGADHQHVTRQNEMYLGAGRGNVYAFAHRVIDSGADIVLGHGPHVTRAVEIYKDRFIIYSLGNFCTYGRFNLRGPNGIAPIIKLQLNPEGRFLQGEIIPVHQPGNGRVSLDPQKRVVFKLQELTRTDFPEIPLEIDPKGYITIPEDTTTNKQGFIIDNSNQFSYFR
jgi:poly-gamma-glutamate capsule biosynthesis protein CapA/YwtB (metallophosphatase superfamily)